ncbi:MAG: DNA double-strand break repair nuclease NurA [Candidatus Bathyarchaeia archaeon]
MNELNYRDLAKRAFPFIKTFLSPIINEDEQETLHPRLYDELVNSGTDTIVRKLKEYNEGRRKLLDDLRKKMSIGRFVVEESVSNSLLVASDASNNGVDFRSAFIPFYASAAIVTEGKKVVDEPIFKIDEQDVWPDEPRARDRESLLAFKLQFEVTLDAVGRWRPKYVLMDGSLLLNYWLLPIRPGFTEEYKKDSSLATLKSIELIYTCFKMDIPVVGFVKRTRVNDICAEMGFPKMRDTALLDAILNVGEYMEPKPIPKESIILRWYRKNCHKMGIPETDIENILNVYFSYTKTGFMTPFRLEFPRYCMDRLGDVGSIILATSEEHGIPFALNEVDSLVRISLSLSNIRTLIIYSKALDLVKSGELSQKDLNLFSLQHGEKWVIKDREYLRDLLRI